MDINIWDWRYRIFFSEDVLRQVEIFIEHLDEREKRVYNNILSFYSSFYSFGILLDEVKRSIDERESIDVESITSKAKKNLDKIIYTPSILFKFYEKEIDNLNISESIKSILKEILSASRDGKIVYDGYLRMNAVLFGKVYDNLVEIIVREGEQVVDNDKGFKIAPDDNTILKYFREFYDSTSSNAEIIEKFGSTNVHDFDADVLPGSCYAEWWDHTLTGEKNRLILYKNEDSLNYNDLKYTVIHEVYPGHGHFYQSIRDSLDPKIDHGLNEVIEGWATYAEWNAVDSQYVRNIRKNALNLLRHSVQSDFKDYIECIYKINRENGLSKDGAMNSIRYLSQYIGFSESYYWGAVMFEYLFDLKKAITPKAFLKAGIKSLGEHLYD